MLLAITPLKSLEKPPPCPLEILAAPLPQSLCCRFQREFYSGILSARKLNWVVATTDNHKHFNYSFQSYQKVDLRNEFVRRFADFSLISFFLVPKVGLKMFLNDFEQENFLPSKRNIPIKLLCKYCQLRTVWKLIPFPHKSPFELTINYFQTSLMFVPLATLR